VKHRRDTAAHDDRNDGHHNYDFDESEASAASLKILRDTTC
jgi:hypothetical protein